MVVRGTRVLDEAGMPRTLSFTVPQARATCRRPSSLNPKPQCNAALRYAYWAQRSQPMGPAAAAVQQ